ncbi:sensor protein CitS [Arthrobacter sp. Hiyo8]|nr:sensor protein CitS [Arthrobacter sp. Hiyo8]
MFGTVATLRDRTEIESLGSELETMKTLSDALRAQTHEHANRLHTIVSLMELGRTSDALDFATKDLELSQQLTDHLVASVDEPVLSALIMGKSAEAHERGAELTVTVTGGDGLQGLAVQDLVTILGNLLDNALDAAAAAPRRAKWNWASTPDLKEPPSRLSIPATGSIPASWTTSGSTDTAPRRRESDRPGSPEPLPAAWASPWSGKLCSGLAVRCPSATPRAPWAARSSA